MTVRVCDGPVSVTQHEGQSMAGISTRTFSCYVTNVLDEAWSKKPMQLICTCACVTACVCVCVCER